MSHLTTKQTDAGIIHMDGGIEISLALCLFKGAGYLLTFTY